MSLPGLAHCVISVVGTVAFDTLARVKALVGPEETGGVLDVQEAFGGTAGNVCTALARLGARPRIVAGVGRDFAGSAYEAALLREGVDLSKLVRVDDANSRCYIFFEDSGRQTSYFLSGASKAIAQADVRLDGRVHFCAGEISAYPRLMEQADWVSFDPGQETFHRALDQIVACLPHVDLIFLNRHELRRLEKDVGLGVEGLRNAGVQVVVETCGADGAVVHSSAGTFRAPALQVLARDPTGAGDAHRAGFLYALSRGAELPVAARFANVLGSFAVEQVGAQAGLPRLDEAVGRYEKEYHERPFA